MKKGVMNQIYYTLLTIVILSLIIVIILNLSKTGEEPSTNNSEISQIQEKRLDYYNPLYKDRYLNYQNNNKDLSYEQAIKNVNMNLDKVPYKDILPTNYLGTEKILVNKYYYLNEDYVPNNLETINTNYAINNMRLVHDARVSFELLARDARKEGLTITAMSAYRSYSYQLNLYNRYMKKDNQTVVDTYSGRPGHSEHQTGLAVDVYNEKEDYTNFQKTDEFKWMEKHAHEYGFILRFPKGKEKETGYQFEAWHYRYVGIDIATYIYENNISFEEYYATKIKDW